MYCKEAHGLKAVAIKVKARNSDEVAVSGIADGTVVALAQPVEGKS